MDQPVQSDQPDQAGRIVSDAQQKTSEVVDASPVMFFEQDAALRYLWVRNSQMGLADSDWVGQLDTNFMCASDAVKLSELKRGVMDSGRSARSRVCIILICGTLRSLDLSLHASRNADGMVCGVSGCAVNIDEYRIESQRISELQLKLKLRALELDSTEAFRNRFISTVTHELRGPLHTLLGYTRLMLLDTEMGSEERQMLETIERSGLQIARQSSDLQSFMQADMQASSLRPKPVYMPTLIDHISESGQILCNAGNNTFVVQSDPFLVQFVLIDEDRLLQVLDNLIGNASKFTKGGTITFQIDGVGIRQNNTRAVSPFQNDEFKDGETEDVENPDDENLPTLAHFDARSAGVCQVRFGVQDNGVGIEHRELTNIFEPFARAEQTQKMPGRGLGLTVARQWVRAMGSDIRVHSNPAQGSTFWFVLDLPALADL